MPIAKWKCPKCLQVVDIDHFEKTSCGLHLPSDYAKSVLDCQEDQFQDGSVRVSTAASCPRAGAIMATEEVAVDPLMFNAMHTGTAWHLLMAGSKYVNHAVNEVEVEGVIDGIIMKGHIDRVLRLDGVLYIGDWKHQKDGNRKFQKEPKPEHIVQTSLYAELYHQTFGERPERGVIWYHYTSSPGVVAFDYDIWPVQKCLAHVPYGGQYTVSHILHQAQQFANGEAKWQDLELIGNEFDFGGKTGCDFCIVRETCLIEATGAPY